MARPKPFTVRSAIVCDDIRREQNGKDILIGVYGGVIVVHDGFPASLPQFALHLEIEISKLFYETSILRIVSPEGRDIVKIAGALNFRRTDEPAILSVVFGPVQFPMPGEYRIHLGLDGPDRRVSSFHVREREPESSVDSTL